MKKINTLLLLLVVIISACKKDQNEVKETALFSRSNSMLKGSRPLHAGDPNLDASWDWTQHSWTAYFNNADGSVGSVTTLNPFIDGAQKVYGNVDASKADMYPANGWMLVSRDFGTSTEANAYPFLLLYNKYRGVLRVCVLRTYDVLSSYQQITLSYASNVSYPDLFKYSSTRSPYTIENGSYINENPLSDSFKQTAITFSGVQQWMIADFDVSGYSSSFDPNTSFNISVSEIAQSDVVLEGNIQLDGTAQPQSAGASDLGLIKNVASFYTKTVEGVATVTKIPKDDIVGTFVGGPNVFLKGLLQLVNLTGFSGGGTSVPYNIKLKGSTTQTGSIKLNSPKASFSVYLIPNVSSSAYRAVQNIPWGIFHLIGTNAYVDESYVEGYEGSEYYKYVQFPPNFFKNSLIINPAIANEVEDVEVLYGLPGVGIRFWPIAEFDQDTRYIYGGANVAELYYGLKIAFKNGNIIFKRIYY
ncbi:hypothetical protein GJU39_13860 [Pedobacter petrophilus]|uniref:Uncharacterized protein n=1 Tax=Pedobacter petrophilus TaxID=1908241 RepID=A0A7K0G0N3_9SPHI|nr:hypothetical protein [Pedobacter petrophilus]MRX77172.1 hypothetical protein [Pedobacter petrophilus]